MTYEAWNKSGEKRKEKIFDEIKFFYEFRKLNFIVIFWSRIWRKVTFSYIYISRYVVLASVRKLIVDGRVDEWTRS